MSRAPDQLAPSWLPRQQRRRIDRQLYKFLRRGTCSICGSHLKHNNSRTASGLDAQGNVVVAGECCIDRVVEIFGVGFYSDRRYDFLLRRSTKSDVEPTNEQIVDAIATYQKAIAKADERLADVERRGDGIHASEVVLLEHPWKSDDRDWFKQNPGRSHRARMPFPGEVDKMVAATQSGRVLIMLVRQVEPGLGCGGHATSALICCRYRTTKLSSTRFLTSQHSTKLDRATTRRSARWSRNTRCTGASDARAM